ncbi:hypothetical protein C9374_008561 [Naegleria lovaniensis]|uniref:Calpain catalytic domain-containing protein n=1 Tax=Naegleria lovaniensis TaxID=51637 RepID=A0AA88KKL4_NAELO|nr:uncharacterized protein C9374_008561 [Naegleria lovaniensis]KAG2377939.1 hypothetical protein C9374_008561 [Naegleria lovaniensis]
MYNNNHQPHFTVDQNQQQGPLYGQPGQPQQQQPYYAQPSLPQQQQYPYGQVSNPNCYFQPSYIQSYPYQPQQPSSSMNPSVQQQQPSSSWTYSYPNSQPQPPTQQQVQYPTIMNNNNFISQQQQPYNIPSAYQQQQQPSLLLQTPSVYPPHVQQFSPQQSQPVSWTTPPSYYGQQLIVDQHSQQQQQQHNPQYSSSLFQPGTTVLNEPFTDSEFPPNETSLGHSKKKMKENNYGSFKRASELCENPQLIIDGIDISDIIQGQFGDCWLLSSLAAVARFPHLIAHLFVRFNISMGQYTLRLFWRNEWKNVTVDDYVPVTSEGEPMVVRSKNPNELWPTIVEKAIAKLFGSYSKVEGGDGTLGIYLFTGCVPQFELLKNCKHEDYQALRTQQDDDDDNEEEYEEDDQNEEECEEEIEDVDGGGGLSRDEIWECILTAFNNGNMIGFATEDHSGLGDEFVSETGIVGGHYYALVDAREYKGHQLVKLRNPWGNTEWKGDWSDVSPQMTDQVRRELNNTSSLETFSLIQQLCANTGLLPLNEDTASDIGNSSRGRRKKQVLDPDDGVFWISLDDVIDNFRTMAIGHLTNIDYLYKEENAFGFKFDRNLLHAIHKSSTFPIYKQILVHDDKDLVTEDEETGTKILTQKFSLTLGEACQVLVALRMVHNDMLKYSTYLELVCDDLDVKSNGLYVFTGTCLTFPKGKHTFHVNSESRNGKFSDIEVTLLWENRKVHLMLNEEEVECNDEWYDEE